jgi:hypothetical protein
VVNDKFIELALDAGLLNYVDHETPRHYFISGHADHEDVEKFAQLIVKECVDFIDEFGSDLENGDVFRSTEKKLSEDLMAGHNGAVLWRATELLREHFGVE